MFLINFTHAVESAKILRKAWAKFPQTCFCYSANISSDANSATGTVFYCTAVTLFSLICMQFWTECFNQTLFTVELYNPNKSPRKCVYSVGLWRELKALSTYSRCRDGLQLPCYSISAGLFHGWSGGIIEYSCQTQCFNPVIRNQAETQAL